MNEIKAQTHTRTCMYALTPLTPSWGAGGGGIATAHFASMQPLSERSWDAQEEEGAREGGDPKHMGKTRAKREGGGTRAKVKETHPFLRVTEGSPCAGGPHSFRLVPAAWQRAESRVKACGLLYIYTVYTGRERERGKRCYALTWFALFLHPDMVALETSRKKAEDQ